MARYVLDASVMIAANRPNEPDHYPSVARIERALTGDDELVLPVTFGIEIAGALGRANVTELEIISLLDALSRPPHTLVTIGPKRSRMIQRMAVSTKLRGADAIYVWTAARYGIPLCTLDREMARRAAALCQVMTP